MQGKKFIRNYYYKANFVNNFRRKGKKYPINISN